MRTSTCHRARGKGRKPSASSVGTPIPTEAPTKPEIRINTTAMTPDQAAALIVDTLLGDA